MVGLDVIRTAAGGAFEWAVFASTTGTPAGALPGEYVGASGDLGIIPRVSTNVLIGGSGRTFALQPVSLGRDRLPSKSPLAFLFLSSGQSCLNRVELIFPVWSDQRTFPSNIRHSCHESR